MARNNQQFTTIRTEGALLPPDILQRIASQKVDGMRPADFHLPEGFKITEAITQSWDMLKKHWKSFQEAREHLADSDTGTSLTNERWLLPLFRELDYGRLTTESSPVIEDRVYPIERFYNKTPIHLIGCNLHLDRRTKGARGAATASPHSMVQEYLNRSEDHLWAFLSNGRHLRLLRDNVALSRQAYVEFDLEAMMEGEVYSDFALLWMLCHQSRLEAEKTDECWLEKWSKLARKEGTRVLKDLRTGVGNAIEALGRGFIGHPQNDDLRRKLQESGSLSKDDFYRQLLRIVYRLLFLFVAEDRELLHPTDAEDKAKDLYRKYYSTNRLREMSLKLRGSKHSDLWHSLSLVFASLGRNDGCSRLGLVGLGSFLWNTKSVADLAGPHEIEGDSVPVQIANDDLLAAIRELAYVEQDGVLRSVDYRNMGSEELGSVYESLLELHPDMHVEARQFDLRTAAGNERKTTGSYYTPDSLVQCLLDSALDPVVEDRLNGKKGEDAEKAILSMTVCDPACGSGHFLIAAAHRLARQLARIRTGESEPSPDDHQHALRDVIGRCIYGVDVNPMAVELCKVSLWIEAIEPGKPLSFLEHHILCGNSLLGTTPKLLADGIPDDAFKPIEGDVKAIVNDLKKQNKAERKDYKRGQRHLFDPYIKLGNLPTEFARLTSMRDDSVDDIVDKERLWTDLISRPDYLNGRLLADTWCAAFVWKKDHSELGKMCPTERDFRQIENNPHSILPHVKSEVRRLAGAPEDGGYQFIHWHLAFPNVFKLPADGEAENKKAGWSAGFDVLLGNPPWERVVLKEKEFFAPKNAKIASAKTAAARRKLIAKLEDDDPKLFTEFREAQRHGEGESHILRASGMFPLCGTGRDINSAFVFSELAVCTINRNGRLGVILPSAIVTDDAGKLFFRHVIDSGQLVHAFDFENSQPLFPGVHRSYKFCLLCAAGTARPQSAARFVFYLTDVSQLDEHERQFTLNAAEISAISPNSRTCPVFRNRSEAELAKHVHERLPILTREDATEDVEWSIKTRPGLFHMTNDSAMFQQSDAFESGDIDVVSNIRIREGERFLPLYEAKMMHQFDHRWFSFDEADESGPNVVEMRYRSPDYVPQPRYWVSESEVCRRAESDSDIQFVVRVITNSTNERTVVSTVLPKYALGNSLVLVVTDDSDAQQLMGALNSYALDFFGRQKIAGTNLNPYILRQLPVPRRSALESSRAFGVSTRNWLSSRLLELTYTAWDMEQCGGVCGYKGPPFRWDEERRFLLRCELDAAYFHLYLGPPTEWGADNQQLREMFPSPRDAVDYIMETFPIVKRKDEKRTEVHNEDGEIVTNGTYITKETILSIYDAIQQAIDSGKPYQTRLDPPPGPPTDEEGSFVPVEDWLEHPPHVHCTRTV